MPLSAYAPYCCECHNCIVKGICNTPGFKDDRKGKDCEAKVQDDAGNAF